MKTTFPRGISMNFKELGPFEGMTYRGRQLFETVIKESVGKREKLLAASTSREGETGGGLFSIHVSDAGYATRWREYTSGQWVKQFMCFLGAVVLAALAAVLSHGVATDLVLRGAYVGALILALLTSLVALFTVGLTYEFVTSLKLGFFKDSGSELFKRLSALSWIVGDVALYIAERDEKSDSTKVRTVFFDAVGSVYADNDKDGEALVLSARDGSEIARMPFPASATGADGNEIAAKIIGRLRNRQPAAVVA